MLLQVAGLTERLAALQAAIRSFSRVNAFVFLEVPAVAEAPAAVEAGVRFLSGVAALVAAEVSDSTEGLSTHEAAVPLLLVLLARPLSPARVQWQAWIFFIRKRFHKSAESLCAYALSHCWEVHLGGWEIWRNLALRSVEI